MDIYNYFNLEFASQNNTDRSIDFCESGCRSYYLFAVQDKYSANGSISCGCMEQLQGPTPVNDSYCNYKCLNPDNSESCGGYNDTDGDYFSVIQRGIIYL